MKNKCILQVEDDENDVFMLQHVFNKTGIPSPLRAVRDGQKAIDYLSGAGEYRDRTSFPVPCLVLLDLKLPFRDGFEVLRWIRREPEFKTLVVVVFSSSDLEEDIKRAYGAGANSYVVKPATLQEALDLGHLFKGWWLSFNQFPPIDRTVNPREPLRF